MVCGARGRRTTGRIGIARDVRRAERNARPNGKASPKTHRGLCRADSDAIARSPDLFRSLNRKKTQTARTVADGHVISFHDGSG